jgi:hypothetical protein
VAISPRWKVYDKIGNYVAACKDIEAAAALVALYGDGASIRDRHTGIVWREGKESTPAFESYDTVALTVWGRIGGKRAVAI